MLLNVRLDSSDERLVRALRNRGVKISEVVRAAIRAEAALRSGAASRDPVGVVKEVIARHPAPPGKPRETRPPLDDSRALRRFIARRMKTRR